MKKIYFQLFSFVLFGMTYAQFSPQVGQDGCDALPATDSSFVAWATGVTELGRGWIDIANPELGQVSFGSSENALGLPAGTFDVVSLGDWGYITLTFDFPIANGPGADFAVFENGFLSGQPPFAFLELGFVEVSSDGENFFRFNAISLTPYEDQLRAFGVLDASYLHNLAGKHIGLWGTPFDLAELEGVSELLDINSITHVRIIDACGSILPDYSSYDSWGNVVNDPWSTPFETGGFDLDAIGVIHTSK